VGVAVAGSDSKKPWDHAGTIIGVVGALVAVFVAITQQRPASAVAVAVAIALLAGYGVVWIMRAKSTKGRPRFPRARWVAITAVAAVLIGAGTAFIVPGSRAVITHDILGFPSISKDVKIVNVLVAESDSSYRISIVTWNGTEREELATRVKLDSECPPPAPADHPDIYQIQQEFKAGVAPGEPPVSGQATLAEEPEFRIQVAGALIDDYCGRHVDLSFGVSVPLPPHQHTSIFVDLPKVFTVPDDRPQPQIVGTPPEPRVLTLPVARPSSKNFVATLVVSAVTLSGSPEE
jgi:hypothetical protein